MNTHHLVLSGLLILANLIYQTPESQAQPFSLRARFSRDSRQLTVTLRNPGEKECGGQFLASLEPRRIEESGSSSSISPFTGTRSVTIKRLGLVRSSGSSLPAYLTARVSCVDNSTWAKRIRLVVRGSRSSSAMTLSQWITRVRAQSSRLLSVPSTVQMAFPPSSLSLIQAFPGLAFSGLIDLQDTNDGTNRLLAVEQGGTIRSFQNTTDVTSSELVLDISSRISSGGERGLLGLAVDPRFSRNRFIYVNYTRNGDGATVISRFTLPESGAADPNSERIILTVNQPFANHNGGSLQFGSDGYLYIALGDGGSGGDPQGNGQSLTTLLGKILRIDVHRIQNGLNYAIPATNPFARNRAGYRKEIFAYGFRNPWRIAFDLPTSRLWAGDVGQADREEIDLVRSGKNYGWNRIEGTRCYPDGGTCSQNGLVAPITEYGRSEGGSVTGGYTFRSSRIPSLHGIYLYGDFISGSIWGVRNLQPLEQSKLIESGLAISSFARTTDGEVFVLDYSGTIYKFQG